MRPSFPALLPAVLATAAIAAAAPAGAQVRHADSSFHWTGKVPAGRWIRIRNLNGSVAVSPASGDSVQVTAIKRWRRGDTSAVRVAIRRVGPDSGSALVCALWGPRATCGERGDDWGGGRHGRRMNDVRLEFLVRVPKDVRVAVNAVNGSITIEGTTSDVEARTVNGEIDLQGGGGRMDVTAINGRVRARLGALPESGRLEFSTVNGSVLVELGADTTADIEMSTVTGSIRTNFPVRLSGRMSPKRVRGHIGGTGGPRIRMSTVNGSVELRRP